MDDNIKVSLSWYVLRLPYGKEVIYANFLRDNGVDVFLPMRDIFFKGQQKRVPLSADLCCVYASLDRLNELKAMPEMSGSRFMMEGGRPLVVPNKEMNNFLAVAKYTGEDAAYLDSRRNEDAKHGKMVEVTDGKYKGVVGEYLRVRSNRCVVVRLLGMASVATGLVLPKDVRELNAD